MGVMVPCKGRTKDDGQVMPLGCVDYQVLSHHMFFSGYPILTKSLDSLDQDLVLKPMANHDLRSKKAPFNYIIDICL